jgi:plastocyanin
MNTPLRLTVLTLLAVCIAVSFAGAAAARPLLIDVADGSLSYSPKVAHVKKGKNGKTVKWTNMGTGTHTVSFWKKPKHSGAKSFSLAEGASKKRTLKKAGTYKYRCKILAHSSLSNGHCSGMCGKIVVRK